MKNKEGKINFLRTFTTDGHHQFWIYTILPDYENVYIAGTFSGELASYTVQEDRLSIIKTKDTDERNAVYYETRF